MLRRVPTAPPRPLASSDAPHGRRSRFTRLLSAEAKRPSLRYLNALLWMVVATGAGIAIAPRFAPTDLLNVALVYVLAIVLVAVRLGQGPSMFATFTGVVAFVYVFVPHPWSFVVADLAYVPTFVAMLVVGMIVSALTSRLREDAVLTQRRELRHQALYPLSRGLAAAETRADVTEVVEEHVHGLFGCEAHVLEYTDTGLAPIPHGMAPLALTPAQADCAQKSIRERLTYQKDDVLFLPMVVANQSVGLLCCKHFQRELLASLANVRLLEAIANNVAIALHRMIVGDDARASQRRIDEERMRNVMLSSMSHDFRTPLATITGAVTTLIDSADRIDEATRLDLMHSIREDAELLERRVRNMLDLTKLESGNLRIHRELHPLDEVVGGAMTRVEKALEGRRVEIDVSPHLPLVAIDALLIEQLLVNLLENAVRYAPAWSPIEVAVHRVGDHIRLQVADRGPGIPRGQHERVFEKFVRVGNTRSSSSGAGLGLAICKAIAQLHGGRIWVEDREGGGASFQIELPIGDELPTDQEQTNVGGVL